jgi:hypothetical protein
MKLLNVSGGFVLGFGAGFFIFVCWLLWDSIRMERNQ